MLDRGHGIVNRATTHVVPIARHAACKGYRPEVLLHKWYFWAPFLNGIAVYAIVAMFSSARPTLTR